MGTATAYSGVVTYAAAAYGQGLASGVLTASTAVGTGGWTVEAYARFQTVPGVVAAFGWGNGWVGTNGTGLTSSGGATGAPFTAGAWHHIAVTGDGVSGASLWVDGVYAADIPDSNTPSTIYIGGRQPAGGSWTGLVDEVRVSRGRRYATAQDFVAPPGPLPVDAATVGLWRLNGNGADATGDTTGTGTGGTGSTGNTGNTGNNGNNGNNGTETGSGATGTPVTLPTDTTTFGNPDRGWFQYTETHYYDDNSGYSPLNATQLAKDRVGPTAVNGVNMVDRTLVFRYFYLEKYRTTATIDADYLAKVDADLAAIRAAGCKAIIRFAYINRQESNGDATPAITMGHVDQLAPTINKYADIVHAVQAGFIGAWGEWYYTYNWGDSGNLSSTDLTNRNALIRRLLDKLDARIFVLLRYLGTRQAFLNTSNPDPGGADSARLGHHNDAFLADDGNWGTYNTFTSLSVTQNRTYLANMPPVPVGGESGRFNPPMTDWANASTEMAAYHYNYLNPNYYGQVVNDWGQTNGDTATRLFGYRLRASTITLPASTASGSTATGSITFINDGWGRLLLKRPVYMVLDDSKGHTATVDLKADLTTVPAGGTATYTFTYTAPATAGTYSIYLALPDPSPVISARPEYAVRLANRDGWQPATGRNSLGLTTTVTNNSSGNTGTTPGNTGTGNTGGSSGTLRNVVLLNVASTVRAVKITT